MTFLYLSVNADNLNLIIDIAVLSVLFTGSAVLSASEVSYFSLKPEDIRSLKTSKSRNSKTALKLHDNPEKLLSTILVAKNTFNILFIFLAAIIAIRLLVPGYGNFPVFIIIMAVITFTLLLAGEVLPKFLASRNRVAIVIAMAPFLNVLKFIFNPVTSLISIYPFLFLRKRIESNNYQAASVNQGINQAAIIEDEKILRGIANFGNTNVSAIMVTRIDVTSIDIKSSFDKIIPVIINSGFSRIPVYSGSFDTVRGILYAKDVLPFAGNSASFKWQSLLRPSYFVPETKKINDLLKEFQVKKIHMAIVIDEYGGTSGIVTLEDILEEIVGEITDESDEEETMFHRIDETKYIFEGKILLNDFCRVFGIEEDVFGEVRGESETLAGLMLELAGEIPQKDQIIRYNNFIFRIEAVDKRRIREILVERINENDEAEA
ncbi:MAG: gliding motility-associated protein GldE [Chloroflexota bacterium]